MTLKKDFLWGGAVAAHQLEGGWNAAEREFLLLMS